MLQHRAMPLLHARATLPAMTTLTRKPDTALSCALGRHQPSRRSIQKSDDMARSRCRHCGCDLVRTASIRAWYSSMLLG
jgi:predicted SprT family Zn-dependent metalloprotease